MPGLSADLDLGPIEVMAGVRAELSTLNSHNAQAAKRRERDLARTRVPASVRLLGNVIIPTPTVRTGLNLGGPSAGFYWMLRRLIVGGVTWKTTAAGTGEVYVTALAGAEGGAVVGPMIAGLALSDMVDQVPSFPNKAYYSDQQVIVQENENVVVVFDTATAAQQYVATAQIQLFRTVAAGLEFST